MVFKHEFYDSDPLPRTDWRPSSSSYDSCATDEGYHTDEKPPFNEQQQQQQQSSSSSFENEIPILKSNRTMYV